MTPPLADRTRGEPSTRQRQTDPTTVTDNAEPAAAPLPSTETERELAAIWQKVLSAEQVSRDASFFDLGGDSLLATRLICRSFKSFRINLPLRRVYEVPTLAAMALEIDARRAGEDSKGATAARAAKNGSPTGRSRISSWSSRGATKVHRPS